MTVMMNNTLEQLLQEQKVSVQKVSENTGVSTLALEYMIQQGRSPKTHVAQKIAKYLGVSVREIWPKIGEERSNPRR